MRKVLEERGFGSLPSSTETNPRDQVKSISTTIKADSYPIRRIGSSQYAISTGVRIKSFLMLFGITIVLIDVNAAHQINAAQGVNAASEEVSIAELVSTAYVIWVESFDNKESLGKDASKQGRIDAIDADEEITMVSVHDVNVSAGEEVFATTIDDITLAQYFKK
ncbi:hypothetical protein Tco_0134072 [Tanacetum coccineum]